LESSVSHKLAKNEFTSKEESAEKYFWSEPRTEKDIIEYCSKILSSDSDEKGRQDMRCHIEIVSSDLPLIVIHNFLSGEMCEEIIEAALNEGNLKRSTMGATQTKSKNRTSSTTWLKENQCEEPLRKIAGKVSRLSGIPPNHMENLQVVRYEPGQKFNMHTDHLDSFNDLDCRGRLATCLLYLNSPLAADEGGGKGTANTKENSNAINTETKKEGTIKSFTGGGETWFPEYNANIIPRQGTAVFWFNTHEKPGMDGYQSDMFLNINMKSRHAGRPVIGGEKWVCNRWMHPISQGANVRGDDCDSRGST